MPAVGCTGPSVLLDVGLLLRRGQCGALARVKAEHDDLVIFACIELQFLCRLEQSIQNEGAEIRAFIVGERQDDRFAVAEKISKRHGISVFIAKDGINGYLCV